MDRRSLGAVSASQMNTRLGRASLGPPRSKKDGAARSRHSIAAPSRSRSSSIGGSAAASGSSRSRQSSSGRASMGRASVGGGRASVGGGRTSLGGLGRISFGRSSISGRRSSVHASATISADPRALSSKEFKSEAIHNLISFLTQNGYNHPISQKILTAPSNKDFIRIFQFVYQCLDPGFPFSDKGEDDVCTLLRLWGYPVKINKSAVFNCGSPHSWPKLLGALDWLVDLAKSMNPSSFDAVDYVFQTDFEGDERGAGDQAFFDYTCKSYEAWMNHDDDDFDELEDGLHKSFKEQVDELSECNGKLQSERKRLMERLDELSGPSGLSEQQSCKQQFTDDIQKFHGLIDKLDGHLAKIAASNYDQQLRLTQHVADHTTAASEKTRLSTLLQQQTLTPTDVERIKSDQAELDAQLIAVQTERETAEQRCWKMEVALSKVAGKLEEQVGGYNKRAEELQLIPASAALAGGVNLELGLQTQRQGSIALSVDPDSLRQHLTSLREQLSVHTNELHGQQVQAKEEYANHAEHANEKRSEVTAREQQLVALKAEYDQHREMLEGEYKDLTQRTNEVKATIVAARTTLARSKQVAELEQSRVKTFYDEQRIEMTATATEARQLLLRVSDMAIVHKEFMLSKLAELEAASKQIVHKAETELAALEKEADAGAAE